MNASYQRISEKMKRQRHSAQFKTRVALEALKESNSTAEIASKHSIHPGMVSQWKKTAITGLPEVFQSHKQKSKKADGFNEEELLAEIGRLKVELDWLKKKC